MDKSEKEQLVKDAYEDLKSEYGSDIFARFSQNDKLKMVQERLPKKPLYSILKIRQIILGKGEG